MKWRVIGNLIPLVAGVLLMTSCSNAGAKNASAQALYLATPAPLAAGGMGGATFPQQIVVVLVTPTAAPETGGQQPSNPSGEGQAVAQAQNSPQPQEGENSQDDSSGGQQQEQQPSSEQSNEGQGENEANAQELITMGEQIYSSNCASCHQLNGEGTSTYPALAGSQHLTGEDPTTAIQIVVNGQGQMPAFGNSLSPEEIAAVISYERNSWSNRASVVTADQVSQVQQGGSAQSSSSEQGESSQEQASPSPTVQGEQDGASGEEQATASPQTGTPQASDGEQTSNTSEGQQQATPNGDRVQASASQEQTGNTITIRIEIVVITPSGPPAGSSSQPASGGAQATPTPSNETSTESSATVEPTPIETSPTSEVQPSEQSQSSGEGQTTPPTEGESSQSPSGEAQATPAQATPGTEGGGDATMAQSSNEELLRSGERVYSTTCANCHQLSGEGNTAYPALNNSAMVTAEDPTAALLTILNGRGHMPSFGGLLSDEEIAAVLSHERTAWENSASIVTVDQVRQARESGSQNNEGQNNEGQSEGNGDEEGSGSIQGQSSMPVITVEAGEPEATGSAGIPIQIYIVIATPAPPNGQQQPPSAESTIAPSLEEGETPETSSSESEDPSFNTQGAIIDPSVHIMVTNLVRPSEDIGALNCPQLSNANSMRDIFGTVWNGRSGMLNFAQFLEIPEVEAVLSSIRHMWNGSSEVLTNTPLY